MNVIFFLINKFFQEEYINSGLVVFFNLIKILLKINGISYITANIIKGVETKNYNFTYQYFQYFIGISIAFIIIYCIIDYLQNNLLTKMTQWVKREILKIILMSNNENFSDVNFIEFITPITRISVSSYVIFSTILLSLIPTFSFLSMIAAYFLYKNTTLGLFFIIANIIIFSYIYYFWGSLLDYKTQHETKINENEKYIINLLNNIDKVIYRGQGVNEMDVFSDKTDEGIEVAKRFYATMNMHDLIINILTHIVLFLCIAYMIYLCAQKKMDATIFITFFTILLFYRDKMNSIMSEIPDVLEFTGRLVYIIQEFKNMLGNNEVMELKIYKPISLNFNEIRFDNVSYLYPKTDKYIFKNMNLKLETTNKIIGITGLSGNGKSTLAKLLIKMYQPSEGNIYIDNVNIAKIDPQYIRENITYVNQNSKLFDKVVIDNMLYGCNDMERCKIHLDEIMKYPKIAKLYKDIDIYSKKTGSLGERVSGGQRQVVNVISGLINPSKILILDEPTNALDIELKRELIGIIKEFKKYKECIIIISHDHDVFSIFDEKIGV
jgi:ABC-type bacteriocin/lantibiotic exporter with double-glycine peptidase domain